MYLARHTLFYRSYIGIVVDFQTEE